MSDDRKILDLQELKNEINAELQEMSEHLANIITLDDVKVFEKIETDPVTGDLLNVEWTPEMRAKAEAKKAEAKQFLEDMAAGKGPNAEEAREAIKQAQKIAKRTRDAVNSFTQNIWTEETREHLRKVVNALDELEALKPFLEDELKKPEYNGAKLSDLLGDITPAELLELPEDSLLFKAMEAARSARAAALPVIDTHKTSTLNTPVDRVNFLAWNSFKETGEQIAFNLMSERDKNDPARRDLNITMRYSLSFGNDPNIKTTKELNHYDRRLMQAVDTLYTNDASGQHIYLMGDIYRAMGGKGDIGNRRDKLNNSLTKQATARVYMDNAAEAKHYNYPHIEYDGNILYFERIRVIYNGQEVEALHFLRRPVFMELADGRKQITDIPLKVLQSGISQTDDNLRIEDYLLQRIARQKNDLRKLLDQQAKKYTQERQRKIKEARQLTILLDTFYAEIGKAKRKKEIKLRAVKTAERYLKHYVSPAGGQYISDYKIKDDRIIITLPA